MIQSRRFSKQQHLRQARDFQEVFKQPHCRSSDANFTVLARRNGTLFARIGLAVSKKKLAKAVDRNRIKRISRESFRLNQQELRGLDVVVIAKHNLHAVQNKQLFLGLSHLWIRLVKKCV